MNSDWLAHEQAELAAGYRCIAGIDEAGRGALAGPVVAACVVLPHNFIPAGVNDSKQLSKTLRENCYNIIVNSAIGIGIGIIQPDVIDQINILKATHAAMREALFNLPESVEPDIALIDGLPVHPFPIAQRAIVGGDAASASIAAASIIAKVTRDRIMVELHDRFPQYQFANHKGYGTREHLNVIIEHGPSSQHRLSYKPVAAALCGAVEPSGQHVLPLAERNG